jgi:hypothetical protein
MWPFKEIPPFCLTKVILPIEKQANFELVITVMYPRITCELVADFLGSAMHILGTAETNECDHFKIIYFS